MVLSWWLFAVATCLVEALAQTKAASTAGSDMQRLVMWTALQSLCAVQDSQGADSSELCAMCALPCLTRGARHLTTNLANQGQCGSDLQLQCVSFSEKYMADATTVHTKCVGHCRVALTVKEQRCNALTCSLYALAQFLNQLPSS